MKTVEKQFGGSTLGVQAVILIHSKKAKQLQKAMKLMWSNSKYIVCVLFQLSILLILESGL